MLYKEVNFSTFVDSFASFHRETSFSYEAKKVLYEYLQEPEKHIELDVVGLSSVWIESTLREVIEEYEIPEDTDALEWLESQTTVLPIKGNTFLYGDF